MDVLVIALVIAIAALAFLAWLRAALRRRDAVPNLDVTPPSPFASGPPRPTPRPTGGRGPGGPAGSRQPRRPRPQTGSGAVALPPPVESRRPTRVVGPGAGTPGSDA